MKLWDQKINFPLNPQILLQNKQLVIMVETISVYWVKIFAILVVFLVLIILFLRGGSEKLKVPGAELVQRELDQLNGNYIVFSNVMIHLERGMSHIPYVVISPYGIFVLSCCYHVGKISGKRNDREWRIKRRGIDETLLNPLWENRKCINGLEKRLNRSLPFVPLVVFTHAKLTNDFGPAVICVDRLKEFFSGHTKTKIGQVDQNSVVAILEE